MGLGNTIARCGGFGSFISNWARSNFKPFWVILQHIPVLKNLLNQYYLCSALNKFTLTVPRIPLYTLVHDTPSMEGMYDESRTTYSRLLPRAVEYTKNLPPVDDATDLFTRDTFTPESHQNLTLLLAFYAQWFTHQFFNTNPKDHRKVNQPVGINMSQLYGSTPDAEAIVRSYSGGLLKSTIRNGEEFPEIVPAPESKFYQGKEIFQLPVKLANKVPGFAAIHVVFFRRHQHIARELARDADKRGVVLTDEELFQKAKMITSINLLRVTMHDYVARSLQSSHVKIKFDGAVKASGIWKTFGPSPYHAVNAIQVEFNFLHRWHHLYPDVIKTVKSLPLDDNDKMKKLECDISKHETDELTFPQSDKWLGGEWNSVAALCDSDGGLERAIFSAGATRAGKLELLNVNEWLVQNVVKPGMKKCREYELASYNDYREHFGFGRMKSFEQVSSDPRIVAKLKAVYKDVDQIEYYPGVFAEDKDFGGIHGPFLATIGVGMTYCGIFASRLFEPHIVNEKCLGKRGMELAGEVNYFQDLTRLHTRLGDARVRFTMPQNAAPTAGM